MHNTWQFPHKRSPAVTDRNPIITAQKALGAISEAAGKCRSNGNDPTVVFDLDGTLFDNRPRVLQIMADILGNEGKDLPHETREIVESIQPVNMSYRIDETLRDAGITDNTVLELFTTGWFKRFFTNEYVVLDRATSGGPAFVRTLLDMQITIVYLTGRDTPNMREGTLRGLEKHNFPLPDENRVHLITKPGFDTPDLEFKQNAIQQLEKIGSVIATFDNEPNMNNLLYDAFPEAIHVFLDTLHSPDFEKLKDGIAIAKDFDLADHDSVDSH